MTTHLARTGPQELKTDKGFFSSVSHLCVLFYRASPLRILLFLSSSLKKKPFPTLS